jgi:hypothetical protein
LHIVLKYTLSRHSQIANVVAQVRE